MLGKYGLSKLFMSAYMAMYSYIFLDMQVKNIYVPVYHTCTDQKLPLEMSIDNYVIFNSTDSFKDMYQQLIYTNPEFEPIMYRVLKHYNYGLMNVVRQTSRRDISAFTNNVILYCKRKWNKLLIAQTTIGHTFNGTMNIDIICYDNLDCIEGIQALVLHKERFVYQGGFNGVRFLNNGSLYDMFIDSNNQIILV